MAASRRAAVVALGAVVLLSAIGVGVTAESGHHSHHVGGHVTSAVRAAGTSPTTEAPRPADAQHRYDDEMAQALAVSDTVKGAVASATPEPAISSAWPQLPVSDDPDVWTRQFVQELLDVDFAAQAREGLGAWLSAEEAPEALPGVPETAQHKILYLSLFQPTLVGNDSTPIPSADAWASNAQAGVKWSVTDLVLQPDQRWAQLTRDGWHPTDPRLTVKDVSGALTVTQGSSIATHHFSLVVYVGSAHWHDGLGAMLVNGWREVDG